MPILVRGGVVLRQPIGERNDQSAASIAEIVRVGCHPAGCRTDVVF
jgi:hypothetical protein